MITNHAPVVDDTALVLEQGATAMITLDVSDPDGDLLSASLIDSADMGAASISGLSFVYRADEATTGSEELRVRVSDGRLTATLTVTVTIVLENLPPVAEDDVYSTIGNTLLVAGRVEDSVVQTRVEGTVLDNDTDPEGGSLEVSEVRNVTSGAEVTLHLDGSFSYLPPLGFSGSDSFDYVVTDGSKESTATVTVTVGELVRFVSASASPGGDGRSLYPFDSLSDAIASAGTSGTVYVIDGPLDTSGATLLPDTHLAGRGATFEQGALTIPPGVEPRLRGGLRLADGIMITGVSLEGGSTLCALEADGVAGPITIHADLHSAGHCIFRGVSLSGEWEFDGDWSGEADTDSITVADSTAAMRILADIETSADGGRALVFEGNVGGALDLDGEFSLHGENAPAIAASGGGILRSPDQDPPSATTPALRDLSARDSSVLEVRDVLLGLHVTRVDQSGDRGATAILLDSTPGFVGHGALVVSGDDDDSDGSGGTISQGVLGTTNWNGIVALYGVSGEGNISSSCDLVLSNVDAASIDFSGRLFSAEELSLTGALRVRRHARVELDQSQVAELFVYPEGEGDTDVDVTDTAVIGDEAGAWFDIRSGYLDVDLTRVTITGGSKPIDLRAHGSAYAEISVSDSILAGTGAGVVVRYNDTAHGHARVVGSEISSGSVAFDGEIEDHPDRAAHRSSFGIFDSTLSKSSDESAVVWLRPSQYDHAVLLDNVLSGGSTSIVGFPTGDGSWPNRACFQLERNTATGHVANGIQISNVVHLRDTINDCANGCPSPAEALASANNASPVLVENEATFWSSGECY